LRRRIVAPADHQDAHALRDRAERWSRLADVELEDGRLKGLGQRPDGDVVRDNLSTEIRRLRFDLSTSANLGHAFLEAHDALARCIFGRSLGEIDGNLLEADYRITRIGHANLPLVDQIEDREAARNFDRSDELAGRELARRLLKLRILQLFQPNPAEVATDGRGGGFGKLPGIGDEAATLAQLIDDPVRVLSHRLAGCGGCRQIDFTDPVFFGANRALHTFVELVHFARRYLHERCDIPAQKPVPGDLALDLPLERVRRR